MIKLTFELDLRADYHVSAGQRAGMTVDSALLRDYDTVPVLRGTALAGLLRDGLLDLLELSAPSLARIHSNDWDKDAAERLFGGDEIPKQWFFSSARPTTHLNASKEAEPRWGSQDVMRVRINPRTRRATPQQLFSQEEGDAQLTFEFTVTCYRDTEQDRMDASLLVAAACMVRHLGSARRRGRGECRIHLLKVEGMPGIRPGEETKSTLELFKKQWLQPKSNPAAADTTVSNSLSPLTLTHARKRFRLIARLAEPVVIARRSEAANAFETLSFIPGTAVVGALAGRMAQTLGLTEHTPPQFVQMFVRGGVRCSGLLPAKADVDNPELYPTIVAPRALLLCENDPDFSPDSPGHRAINALTITTVPRCCLHEEDGVICTGKLKPATDFLTVGEYPEKHNPDEREEMHIRMERKTGRVKEGDLYEYIALEAGQWFVGELDCDTAVWDQLQTFLDLKTDQACDLRLGRATRRGYGLTQFVLEEMDADEPSPWVQRPLADRLPDIKKEEDVELSLLLLTDTIVPDSWGRFYHSFAAQWLADALQVDTEDVTVDQQIRPEQIELFPAHIFAAARHVDSFNTYRYMPRWRDTAVVAGSAARVKITAAGMAALARTWHAATGSGEIDTLQALQWHLNRLEKEGVGMRRHEGFGRLAFNHPIFSPDDDLKPLNLGNAQKHLLHQATSHGLQAMEGFRQEWIWNLDNSQQKNKKTWEKIDGIYGALARFLFSQRYQPITQIQEWLETDKEGRSLYLGQPNQLWGEKPFVARDSEARVSNEPLALIKKLITELAVKDAAMHPLGFALLAERIAEAADEGENE